MSSDIAKLHLDSSKKTVMITGVTGQDGSLMADLLLNITDYNIIGGARRLSVENHDNIKHLVGQKRFNLVNFDLTDTHSIDKLFLDVAPDFFINLAAQSFVKSSFDFPVQTSDTNTTGVIHILEAIRQHRPSCRFYNAGSSEEFGDVLYEPQDELHPPRSRSPYAASKASSRQWVKVYRDSYKLFAIQAWLFNHEGPRRGKEFVTRKITNKVVEIYNNIRDPKKHVTPLELGNLDAKRDWSDAEDMVRAIWMMLTHDKPIEYVVCSGETHSVREFVEAAFAAVGISGSFTGPQDGVNEVFWYSGGPKPLPSNECNLVKINPAFYRPAEVDHLRGDSSKIRKELGWIPKTTFKQLVEKMVENDLALFENKKG